MDQAADEFLAVRAFVEVSRSCDCGCAADGRRGRNCWTFAEDVELGLRVVAWKEFLGFERLTDGKNLNFRKCLTLEKILKFDVREKFKI